MAFSSSTSTSTINNHPFQPARLQPPPSRSLRRPSATASTPNLNSVYAQTSTTHSAANNTRPAPSVLARKTSLATLTSSSLASIPDATESYAFDSVLTDTSRNMAPATPGRLAARSATGSVAVGDIVDVPGNMQGTVRFVGSVQGKNGVFAGVELDENFAARGKNNGDVDGVSYFSTMIPGAGIFLPVAKAVRRDSPGRPSWGSVPQTPTGTSGLKNGSQNSTNYTPPTPGLPKLFSASVGPGARAPSPQGKRPPRTSLPRPDSPVRRQQMTPGPRPSIATPAKTPARYGSPTNRFAQSVRGTAGDPAKKGSRLERMPSLGPRSASALGSASGMDDDATPTGRPPANGNFGSVSSYNNKMRPPSRTNGGNAANDDEVERLRAQLEERDRQFKEQAANLSEMEASLTELQSLMESSELSGQKGDLDDKDTRELKMIIKEKNEKIAMLTAEFDAHRADFRSTIDTLEMASTETERVYEKRIEELMAELRELESRNLDVDSVASQLKQLEELVQELEEGLEDARRGEAEARGEVEFLRGEVERTRTELRREREKANAPAHGGGAGDMATSKELEKKEDEIRGLKAIIHSLSRDSIPNQEDRTPTQTRGSLIMSGDSVENKIARDNLERQVAELQSIVEKKSGREEELERELESLRNGNSSNQRDSINLHRSSLRDSRDTVILSRAQEVRSPEVTHKRAGGLASMPESDTYSTATENSTLWCEICETSGHDILTCTNMFGSEAAAAAAASKPSKSDHASLEASDAAPAPLSPAKNNNARPASPAIKILPNPMESGPVAGKESGIMDPEKWCAVCERDGHDSVDCPFEDAF